jgi:hypothetical protein
MRALIAVVVLSLPLASCTSQPRDGFNPDRILHMAGEEASQIHNPRERLARQLNIAFRQIGNGKQADARSTLAQARRTMEASHDATVQDQPPLSDHDRLAGWISISELSRGAEDAGSANLALDRALSHLNKVEPPVARCEYVPGIAREVRELRGDAPAAKLLVTAGQWSGAIAELPTRRAAYIAFAEELFRCNDYEAARQLLRRDEDPSWRSDALTALSDGGRYGGLHDSVMVRTPRVRGPLGTAVGAASEEANRAEAQPAKPFGKAVDFRSTFYRGN